MLLPMASASAAGLAAGDCPAYLRLRPGAGFGRYFFVAHGDARRLSLFDAPFDVVACLASRAIHAIKHGARRRSFKQLARQAAAHGQQAGPRPFEYVALLDCLLAFDRMPT